MKHEAPYNWRDPEVLAHWANVRAEIAAKRLPDAHQYRNDATSEHAHFMANQHITEAAKWARKAQEIDAQWLT